MFTAVRILLGIIKCGLFLMLIGVIIVGMLVWGIHSTTGVMGGFRPRL